MGAPSISGAYLHITGLTQRGKQLTELKITETIDGLSVTSIKDRAFRACTNVRKVTVAGSVRSIGNEAFAGCSSLETLVMKGNVPPAMGEGVLEFCPAVISVPPAAMDAYSNNAGWSSYSTRLVTYYTV
ncbi:MAG: leucine-rich repeat protein, partial [Spirochaetia bacterium]|nr:leucine-rich repeat protein [Spirochaetia bacterium]